jgi:hypothetical protein
MKALLKSFTVPVLLSGAWGAATYVLGYLFLSNVPIGYMFFYPIMMTGVAVAVVISGGSGVSHARAALTGFITGFIYLLVSPMFPILASVIAGASLGGGLSGRGGRFGGLLSSGVSTVIGMIIFPLVIKSGELLGACVLIFLNSIFLSMVFWGAWLGLGVCLIRFPVAGRKGILRDKCRVPGLDEFRDEAGEIKRDLGELDSGIEYTLSQGICVRQSGFIF